MKNARYLLSVISVISTLTATLFLSACDSKQAPKIANPLAGQAEALQKVKDLERQLQESTDKRIKQLEKLN